MAPVPRKPVPAPAPAPSPSSLRPGWEKDLTERYRQLLSTKRMNQLQSRRTTTLGRSASNPSQQSAHAAQHPQHLPLRHGSGIHPARSATPLDHFPLGAPAQTSAASLSNIPIMATAPSRQSHHRFRNELHMLSETPCKWENPGLLDEAMRALPLERLYRLAEDEAQYFKAAAASLSPSKKPSWAFQDCLIRQLLKWFKREFFQFINVPKCSRCGGNTMPVDNGTGTGVAQVAPSPDERALSAHKVELYYCPRQTCGARTRFARYNDAFVLMQMRKGRVGEWVNTFSMLCRALGSRVRWVWVLWNNNEDHSWTEVYSDYRRRWIHVDPCEERWDNPTMYTEGWGRKIRYCIAFGTDGACDVTSRYCRNPLKHGGERTKCPEDVLLFILDEIRRTRRRNMDKDAKFKLEGEDIYESRELKHYYVSALMAEVIKLVPKTGEQKRLDDADRRKAEERRLEAIHNRERSQEGGRTSPRTHPDMPPPPP